MYYSRESSQMPVEASDLSAGKDLSAYYSSRARSKLSSTSSNGSTGTGSGSMTSTSTSTGVYAGRKEPGQLIKEKQLLLTKDTDVHVGFSDLPNQIHRKTGKKGFEFTLMVAGACSLRSQCSASRAAVF